MGCARLRLLPKTTGIRAIATLSKRQWVEEVLAADDVDSDDVTDNKSQHDENISHTPSYSCKHKHILTKKSSSSLSMVDARSRKGNTNKTLLLRRSSSWDQ
eukprot:4571558-Ditylum_brightwellii.AAC.1